MAGPLAAISVPWCLHVLKLPGQKYVSDLCSCSIGTLKVGPPRLPSSSIVGAANPCGFAAGEGYVSEGSLERPTSFILKGSNTQVAALYLDINAEPVLPCGAY